MRRNSLTRFLYLGLVIPIVSCQGRVHDSPANDHGTRNAFGTRILRSLEDQIPEGSNAVWCLSHQLAAKSLDDLLESADGLPLAGTRGQLTHYTLPASALEDFPRDSCYVAAGSVGDGIIQRIAEDLSRRFPTRRPSLLSVQADTRLIGYSFLDATIRFPVPFHVETKPMEFSGIPVRQFGILDADAGLYSDLRRQVDVLFVSEVRGKDQSFILDLCKSSPVQVLLAKITQEGTLAELLDGISRLCSSKAPSISRLGLNDVLLLPEIAIDVEERYRSSRKGAVADVVQRVTFSLNESGAFVEAEAVEELRSFPRVYAFNVPFLVVLRRRGSPNPFLVMWVQNAHALVKSTTSLPK